MEDGGQRLVLDQRGQICMCVFLQGCCDVPRTAAANTSPLEFGSAPLYWLQTTAHLYLIFHIFTHGQNGSFMQLPFKCCSSKGEQSCSPMDLTLTVQKDLVTAQ